MILRTLVRLVLGFLFVSVYTKFMPHVVTFAVSYIYPEAWNYIPNINMLFALLLSVFMIYSVGNTLIPRRK